MDRRSFLVAGAVTISGCTALSDAESSSPTTGRDTETTRTTASTDEATTTAAVTSTVDDLTLGLEPVVEDVGMPVAYEPVLDGGTQFVADVSGRVYVRRNGKLREEPILDLADRLTEIESWEQGLVGFTVHPEFETNRRIYVRYSGRSRDGTPADYSHTFVLAEFEVPLEFSTIDPSSERTVLEIPEPGPVHNGGALDFGPDGHLYVGVGDGGGGQFDSGHGHAKDWYDPIDGGNGQDVTENLLGSILRINVDDRDGDRPYGIPSDNPLVGTEGLDEHYAWGLRNPYQMAWTDGRLIVGDVGQDSFEELNVVERGANYGWNVREGPDCSASGSSNETSTCPETTDDGERLVGPVAGYRHRETKNRTTSVIAGYVYTGSALPVLTGRYVFGDLMRGGKGHVFAADPSETEDGLWTTTELSVQTTEDEPLTAAVISLSEGQDGELYVSTYDFQSKSGTVSKLVRAT